MDELILKQTGDACGKLDAWVQSRRLAGYDPYDLRGTRAYLWSSAPSRRGFLPAKLLRGAFSVLEQALPVAARNLTGVRPSLNAKAMGLFAKAYLNLSQVGDGDALRKATDCLEWLVANCSTGYSGMCWGYPFDWQSTILIPKGTPSSVVSWTVGDAFWRAYEVTGKREYLEVCRSVCDFLSTDLNRHRVSDDQLCTSYTPLDRMHVFNAALFVGEFLVRIGNETAEKAFVRDGTAITNYVVANQNPDGSWPYYGPEDRKPATVDHYHTGFVLRMLSSVSDLTGNSEYEQALRKGFEFYWNSLFEPCGLPRYFVDRVYPVNIHSIAEAIICLRLFDGKYCDTSARLEWVLDWTLKNMRDPAGFFYYLKHEKRTEKIPYMRWAQAWMLLAMSEVLVGYADGREQFL